jgi:calcium-dependent protein kinase
LESEDKENLNIKITDFGFACFYTPEKGVKEVLGSPLYMAPEIIHEELYDQKVDIWSTGIIAYILLCGRPPFKGKSKPDIFQSITRSPVMFDGDIWRKVSDEAKDFIVKCLNKEKNLRPSATELLDHPWIVNKVRRSSLAMETQLDIADNLKQF